MQKKHKEEWTDLIKKKKCEHYFNNTFQNVMNNISMFKLVSWNNSGISNSNTRSTSDVNMVTSIADSLQ